MKNYCGKNYCKYIIGPTGPTGPNGKDVEARSTYMVECKEKAKVISTSSENKTYLDFYIPKGEKGISETIKAGNTSTTIPGKPAIVNDRYENDTHYLDFIIPQGIQGPIGPMGEKGSTGPTGKQGERGEKGEKGDIGPQGIKGEIGPIGATGPTGPKGDKGETGPMGETGPIGPRGFPGEIGISEVITIDETITVDSSEKAEVQDDFDRNIHHLTFYIPKGEKGDIGPQGVKGEQGEVGPQGVAGPQGEQGIQGVAGPPGSVSNLNITIYNSISQTIQNGLPLRLDEVAYNNNMKRDNFSVTAPVKGTYLVSFSINNGNTASSGEFIAVNINSQMVNASKRPLTVSTNTSATVILNLEKNDVITLVPSLTSDRTLNASGAPSATLTVVNLSA